MTSRFGLVASLSAAGAAAAATLAWLRGPTISPPPPQLAKCWAGLPGEMLSATTVSEAQWKEFDEQGFVKLGKVVRPGAVRQLQQQIDRIMLGEAEVPYPQMMMQLDSLTGRYEDMGAQTLGHKGASLGYRKIQNLDQDEVFMAYMRAPLFRAACARVYGETTPISSFRSMFFNKPAKAAGQTAGGTVLPWHQDVQIYTTLFHFLC